MNLDYSVLMSDLDKNIEKNFLFVLSLFIQDSLNDSVMCHGLV